MENIIFVDNINKLTKELPFDTPIMVKEKGEIHPSIYINTAHGFVGVDIDFISECGYNSCNIFFIPHDACDIVDVARVKIEKPENKESPILASFYGDLTREEATAESLFTHEDIQSAFDLED